MVISFFDDGEETAPRPARPRASAPTRPRPRRPQGAGAGGVDPHTLMVRRWVALGVGLVLVIVIVLIINGCLKSQSQEALKEYNHSVSTLAQESDTQVAQPLFGALTNAAAKSALNVEVQIDQLRIQAQRIAEHAERMSVPGAMTSAQRDLLLALHLRVEGMAKLATLLPSALGGQNSQAPAQIAGAMELFLASDVIYSQRVVPLIQQTLAGNGIHELSTSASRFLPNIGWLEPNTVQARISGQSSGGQSKQPVSGNHGSALISVAVGTNTLAPEPTLNHIAGGSSPTFTLTVENSGEFPETNVKAEVTITAAGKQYKASHTIDKTEPGKKVNVEIPVAGVPLGVAAKVEANVAGVPCENDLENNKAVFLAIFSQ